MNFDLKKCRTAFHSKPFEVEAVSLATGGKDLSHEYFRLKCPDWVNVLPITDDGHAILIKQPRAGTLKEVLETPGGVIEPAEHDPTLAAKRELEEETGYTSQRFLSLGNINPNPAIMTNRCHFFIATSSKICEQRTFFPDPEEFIQIHKTPIDQLEELVRLGRIDHCLSALCILLARKYLS